MDLAFSVQRKGKDGIRTIKEKENSREIAERVIHSICPDRDEFADMDSKSNSLSSHHVDCKAWMQVKNSGY